MVMFLQWNSIHLPVVSNVHWCMMAMAVHVHYTRETLLEPHFYGSHNNSQMAPSIELLTRI